MTYKAKNPASRSCIARFDGVNLLVSSQHSNYLLFIAGLSNQTARGIVMPIQKRTIGDIPYTIIPNIIFQLNNSDAIAIWCYLHSKPENWVIRRKDIMQSMGVGRQRYDNAIKLLKDHRLFVTEHSQNIETGKLEGSVAWLFLPKESHRTLQKPTTAETDMSITASVVETDHLVSKDSLVSKEVIQSKDKSLKHECFTEFWNAYPKKKNKQQAIKAFKAQKINGELKVILADIEKLKSSDDWMREGGQFIPYPASYLNGRRWEDEEDESLSWAQREDRREQIAIGRAI